MSQGLEIGVIYHLKKHRKFTSWPVMVVASAASFLRYGEAHGLEAHA